MVISNLDFQFSKQYGIFQVLWTSHDYFFFKKCIWVPQIVLLTRILTFKESDSEKATFFNKTDYLWLWRVVSKALIIRLAPSL